MDSVEDPYLGTTIGSRYSIVKKLGEGSFGVIYLASSGNKQYAIKIEKKRSSTTRINSLIITEAKFMQVLLGCGIPKIYELIQEETSNIMIMERLGKSLEMLLHVIPNKKMSIKTVAMLGYHMISILEHVHSLDIIHRDLKPENFTMGHNKKNNKLYLIDFGLAKYYRDPNTKIHQPMIKKKKLTGTARYASLNALQGLEQSRRDDIESIGYLIIYLLKGTLPWKTIMIKNKEEKYYKIMQKKKIISPSELCKNEPIEFEKFVKYSKGLNYQEDPNYEYMKDLFLQCLSRFHYNFDNCYDWNALDNISSPDNNNGNSNIGNESSINSDYNNDEDNKAYNKEDNDDDNSHSNHFSGMKNIRRHYLKQDSNKAYINNYFINQSVIQKDKNSTDHRIHYNNDKGHSTSISKQMKNEDVLITKSNTKAKVKKSSSITHLSKGKNSSKVLSSKSMSQVTEKCLSKCCIVI